MAISLFIFFSIAISQMADHLKNFIMDDRQFKEWQSTMDNKSKNLAYNAHFHSLSHFLSAEKYKKIHNIMTYGMLFLDLGIGAGAAFASFVANPTESPVATKWSLGVLVATATLNGLKTFVDLSDISPRKMNDLHYEAACLKNDFSRRVEAWSDVELNKGTPDEKMLGKFNEFLKEFAKIEKDYPPSEFSTYKDVHKQLSPKWKEMARNLRKYIPEE